MKMETTRMTSIKELNDYCHLNDKRIIVYRGKLCGLGRGYRLQ